MVLIVLTNISQAFCSPTHHRMLLMFSPALDRGYRFGGGRPQSKEPFSSVVSSVHASNRIRSLLTLTLIAWLRSCWPGVSTVRLLFFLLPILSSLAAQPTLKEWEAMLHFLEEEYLLGIPLHRRLAFDHSGHLFIYSVIFFPVSLWTHEYLFYSLNYQYIYSVTQIAPCLITGNTSLFNC